MSTKHTQRRVDDPNLTTQQQRSSPKPASGPDAFQAARAAEPRANLALQATALPAEHVAVCSEQKRNGAK